jgi:uncharacterized FAD-dependent dehydrogenase
MIRIPQLKLHVRHTDAELRQAVKKELRLSHENFTYLIRKRSIDARKKQELHYVYAIDVELSEKEERQLLTKSKGKFTLAPKEDYSFEPCGTKKFLNRPVIIGAGPAGLFCAYFLAKYGYTPIIVERGEAMEDRIKRVEEFWNGGSLNKESNVQFGEGGAGTFSDGKLNTMVKDPAGRIREVLKIFVEHGAPEEILYLNKHHIGTDNLRHVIVSMRKQMIDWGAEFLFSSKVTDVVLKEDGSVKGVEINGSTTVESDIVVAALGHSARDTFELLSKKPLTLENKAFAIGVRMEHPQEMIGRAQYGDSYSELPAADYKLTHQCENGRGVYSFCMCPGGFVVNASSEENRLVVNGMSNHDRSEKNANSALIVTVTPEDFQAEGFVGPLAGMQFQRKWEDAAYMAGNGKIPMQLFGDLLSGKKSATIGEIVPNTKGAWTYADLNDCLPQYVLDSLKEGILAFDKKIPGFARKDGVLLGVETRTSSPIRIVRGEDYQSDISGFYPCGEGAGYAGGITSAAVDGIKVFEAITTVYSKNRG